jgi:hypothetical protein
VVETSDDLSYEPHELFLGACGVVDENPIDSLELTAVKVTTLDDFDGPFVDSPHEFFVRRTFDIKTNTIETLPSLVPAEAEPETAPPTDEQEPVVPPADKPRRRNNKTADLEAQMAKMQLDTTEHMDKMRAEFTQLVTTLTAEVGALRIQVAAQNVAQGAGGGEVEHGGALSPVPAPVYSPVSAGAPAADLPLPGPTDGPGRAPMRQPAKRARM